MDINKIIKEEIYKLYHGTNYIFDKFNLSKFNAGSGDGGWLGKGLYFTNDINYAESYIMDDEENGSLIEATIDIKNPYVLTDPLYSRRPTKLAKELNVQTAKGITIRLHLKGYDGVLLKYPDSDVEGGIFIELCVFNPESIKHIKKYPHSESN